LDEDEEELADSAADGECGVMGWLDADAIGIDRASVMKVHFRAKYD
jgi:hypothetical protein